jgi:hypothetical protein
VQARGAFLLAIPLLLAGCVSFSWSRRRAHELPPTGAVAALTPGRTTLTEALDSLGAPLYVWEYKGDGAALAWGWSDDDNRGVAMSLPLQRQLSASFSYDSGSERLRGIVLLFDSKLVLDQVREGWLRDLSRDLGRRRPAPVDS